MNEIPMPDPSAFELPITSFPVFLIGEPGTLPELVGELEAATIRPGPN